MARDGKTQGQGGTKAPGKADERIARSAAALRENLRRRKAQARARTAKADAPAERPPPRD